MLLFGRLAQHNIYFWPRHYFANKGPSSQGYGFSSGHAWCESWTIKKPECRRIDAFELWCWRRLLRAPWTARRSNQSILEENSPGSSLEWLMLKVKLQYFGHVMQRADSFEKTLMLGKIEGRCGGHMQCGTMSVIYSFHPDFLWRNFYSYCLKPYLNSNSYFLSLNPKRGK